MAVKWISYLTEMLSDNARFYNAVGFALLGASGPKVVILYDDVSDKMFALKYGFTRIPIQTQVENRAKLLPFFEDRHLPKIFNFFMRPDKDGAMLMEYAKGWTLHDAVVRGPLPDESIVKFQDRILRRFLRMWRETKKPWSNSDKMTRDPQKRSELIQRLIARQIVDGVVLEQVKDLPLIINGRQFPSVTTLLQRLSAFQPPPIEVLCHGDPNADNIIINKSGDWYLVDWEWVGQHDWRLVMSHFIGWWLSNAASLSKPVQCRVVDGVFEISYEKKLPSACLQLMENYWQAARAFAQEIADEKWEDQLNIYLGTLLLGDIRFVHARDREEYVAYLLGEGLSILGGKED